jgi:hypothetical protein
MSDAVGAADDDGEVIIAQDGLSPCRLGLAAVTQHGTLLRSSKIGLDSLENAAFDISSEQI